MEEDGLVLVPVPQEVAEMIERLSAAARVRPAEFVGEHLAVLLHLAEHLLSLGTTRRNDTPGYL